MALESALAKIEEYNALMHLPQAGLLGIGALLTNPQGSGVATEDLKTCIQICHVAEMVLSGNQEARRENVHLFSTLEHVYQTEEERHELLQILKETRNAFESTLRRFNGDVDVSLPTVQQLQDLAQKLRKISQRVKRAIPRDSYLASLTGRTHPSLRHTR